MSHQQGHRRSKEAMTNRHNIALFRRTCFKKRPNFAARKKIIMKNGDMPGSFFVLHKYGTSTDYKCDTLPKQLCSSGVPRDMVKIMTVFSGFHGNHRYHGNNLKIFKGPSA